MGVYSSEACDVGLCTAVLGTVLRRTDTQVVGCIMGGEQKIKPVFVSVYNRNP
jgi:hypothetical protein